MNAGRKRRHKRILIMASQPSEAFQSDYVCKHFYCSDSRSVKLICLEMRFLPVVSPAHHFSLCTCLGRLENRVAHRHDHRYWWASHLLNFVLSIFKFDLWPFTILLLHSRESFLGVYLLPRPFYQAVAACKSAYFEVQMYKYDPQLFTRTFE